MNMVSCQNPKTRLSLSVSLCKKEVVLTVKLRGECTGTDQGVGVGQRRMRVDGEI